MMAKTFLFASIIYVTVNIANIDEPDSNQIPIVSSQNITVEENSQNNSITLIGNDADGDALTYSYTNPIHGTLSGVAPNLTYIPGTNYDGLDSFTFKVNDGIVDSLAGTINITINNIEVVYQPELTFIGESYPDGCIDYTQTDCGYEITSLTTLTKTWTFQNSGYTELNNISLVLIDEDQGGIVISPLTVNKTTIATGEQFVVSANIALADTVIDGQYSTRWKFVDASGNDIVFANQNTATAYFKFNLLRGITPATDEVPTNLTLSSAVDGITLNWNGVDGAANYNLYVSNFFDGIENGNYISYPATQTSYLLPASNLVDDAIYYFSISTDTSEKSNQITTQWIKSTLAPENIATLQQEDSVLVSWDEVTGASKYIVYFSLDGVDYVVANGTGDTQTSFIFQYADISGYFKVQADDGELSDSVAFTWSNETNLSLTELFVGETIYQNYCGNVNSLEFRTDGTILNTESDGQTSTQSYRIEGDMAYLISGGVEQEITLVEQTTDYVRMSYGADMYFDESMAQQHPDDKDCSQDEPTYDAEGSIYYNGNNYPVQNATSYMSDMPNNPVQIFLRTSDTNSHAIGGFQLTMDKFVDNNELKTALRNNSPLYLIPDDFAEYGLQYMLSTDNPTGVTMSGSIKLTWLNDSDRFSIEQNGATLEVDEEQLTFSRTIVQWTDENHQEPTSLNYQNNLASGVINNIQEYKDAKYIRIIPTVDSNNDNWEGLMCELNSDYSFGNNCVLTGGANIENFQDGSEYQFSVYPTINEYWRGSGDTMMAGKYIEVADLKNISMNFNIKPMAYSQSVSVAQNSQASITLSAMDADGDSLSYSKSNPSHGTLSGTLPYLTYTPEEGYVGNDSFSFSVNDGIENSSFAEISITVN